MSDEIIRIPKLDNDSYKNISLRIKEGTLRKLDNLAYESNNSRSGLINILLESAVNRIKIE